jgi:hypothetical protein
MKFARHLNAIKYIRTVIKIPANSYYSLRRLNIEKHSLSEMSSKKHATTANSIQSSRPRHLWQPCRIRIYGTLMSKPNTFMTQIILETSTEAKVSEVLVNLSMFTMMSRIFARFNSNFKRCR